MATVYLATDLRLERRVAIKVMHGHLADDSQYKARFIQEARSAARLAHPNVVNVYDQGQDDETAYLVMEYLPGITLRDLLLEHKVLTTVQAMDIMEAILSGLAAAHKNGIVHRDLKPENVLLADDGRIKIGDFGLARAATANTATGNALLGTIAYLSPELVTRGVADARSDIYAVGIMLYEMLAGEQPFRGEQAFQIAHQHANDTVPTPSTKNPQVPAELDELVLWATARDPEQRPRDARVMLEQLHETESLLKLDDPSAAATTVQRTMVMPSAVALADTAAATQVLTQKARHRTGPILSDSANLLAAKSDGRRRRGFWLFALVILLTALAGGTGWYFGVGPGADVGIPNVAGQSQAAARAAIAATGLAASPTTGQAFSPTIPVGSVVATTPTIGKRVAKGSSITLLLSSGPKPLPFPALAGLTTAAAKAKIAEAGFRYSDKYSAQQFDAKIPLDQVIQAIGAAGTDITAATQYGDQQPVSLVVSAGPVPNVIGLSVADATAKLKQDANLTAVSGRQAYSASVPAGDVISLEMPTTPVRPGGSISMTISKGPEQVVVPNVVGMTWQDAKQTLLNAGFTLDYNPFADAAPTTFIVSKTNPAGGATVDKGTKVKVNFTSSF
jgi:serine/threonine-protein kinase